MSARTGATSARHAPHAGPNRKSRSMRHRDCAVYLLALAVWTAAVRAAEPAGEKMGTGTAAEVDAFFLSSAAAEPVLVFPPARGKVVKTVQTTVISAMLDRQLPLVRKGEAIEFTLPRIEEGTY